jgi:hypothetical protein
MVMRSFYHKDMMGKLINPGDFVVWASKRQGYGMRIALVERFTARQVWIKIVETGELRRCFHHHLLVITAQIKDNETNGTMVEIDLPAEGFDTNRIGMQPGQSARSWFANNGIDIAKYLADLKEKEENG